MTNSIYSQKRLRELARKLDMENNCTPFHSEKVADCARDVCRAMKIRGRARDMVITACLLHDVGKIGISNRVWAKQEKLDDAEWKQIRMHPVISARLAQEAGYEKKVSEIIYYHHVWYNGHGYPSAPKKGSRMPLGARILAICDAYAAMTSNRPYREAMPPGLAVEELTRHSIEQFDPKIVEVFVKIVGDVPPATKALAGRQRDTLGEKI